LCNFVESGSFEPFSSIQEEMLNGKESNVNMYSSQQNALFPEIPQRGHSQSLQFHDHRYYSNTGASSDPYNIIHNIPLY